MTPRDLLACIAAIGLGSIFLGSTALAGWEILHNEAVNPTVQQALLLSITIASSLLHLNIGVGLDPIPKTTSTTDSITASTSTNEPAP